MKVLLLGICAAFLAATPNIVSAATEVAAGEAKVSFSVKDYGAVGDGKTLDSAAINRAIEACSASGGGTVCFPAGTYLCGSIRLKSHVRLYLGQGCLLKSAPLDINAFDIAEKLPYPEYQDFGHSTWRNALIWGENLEHVTIEGPGLIDGGTLRSAHNPGGGDKVISLKLCRNITVKDISIYQAGHFGMLLTGCDNITVDNVTVDTNRDGINLDCCRYARVSNCIINSDDDGLCLKSSYALGYARATENVTITNCILSCYKTGSVLDGTYVDEGPFLATTGGIKRIGRIKFGTESNGGFRNIAISNCVFDHCWSLALETVDGGILENVTVTNISMKDIADTPIFIRLGKRMRGPEGTPVGVARNIIISNITATTLNNHYGSIISGIPGYMIQNLTLSDIKITCPGGGTKEMAERVYPENETGGPGERMFGENPAYGFYIRHVDGLTLRGVRIDLKGEDARPAIILDDVKNLRMEDVEVRQPSGVKSLVIKKGVTERDAD